MEQSDLLAPCSDYCGGCGQYTGLISETARQLREFADLYGFEFRSQGAFDFKQFVAGLEWFMENAACPGCWQGGGPPWCEVRTCSSEKGLRICFECAEFPCAKFKEYADADTMERYARFRELGFDRWIEEQVREASAGYEIHLQRRVGLRPAQKGEKKDA